MQLPEIAQFGHRQVVAGQMQQGIKKHGAVTIRQDEAVAVRPTRVCRIVFQVVIPQNFRNVGHAHRHTGMSGVGLLHGVHG